MGGLYALERSDQTAIFRLRTGHCGLRAQVKRIGVAESALCNCKTAEQTVHHVLQDCPLLDTEKTNVATGGTNHHHQVVGSAGRPAQQFTIQFLTALGLRFQARFDRTQKKKKKKKKDIMPVCQTNLLMGTMI